MVIKRTGYAGDAGVPLNSSRGSGVRVGLCAACPSKARTFPAGFGGSVLIKLCDGRVKQKANERIHYKSCSPTASFCSYVLLFNQTIMCVYIYLYI